MSTIPARLASLDQAARYFDVSTRTLRTYLSQGKITGYKRPGKAGLLFDLDECKRVLPPKYGKDAKIVQLPANVVLSEGSR